MRAVHDRLRLVAFLLFGAAASIIALSPGPGLLYVAARYPRGRPATKALPSSLGTARAFRDGIVVEALNPKTAALLLARRPA